MTAMVDTAIGELVPIVGVRQACAAIGVAQADWYRRQAATTRAAIERGDDVIFQACFFQCPEGTVKRYVAEHHLTAIQIGKERRFRAEDVLEFIACRPSARRDGT